MPRKSLPPRKAQSALLALRLESARRSAMAARKLHHAEQAALALRRSLPEWIDLDRQLKRAQVEVEMDAMEACIDARTPKIPTLNFDLMPGFSPPSKLASDRTETASPDKTLTTTTTKKDWTYPGYDDGRRPEDDWRNYE